MYNNKEEEQKNRTEVEERIPSFFRFEDLRVYHKSMDYLLWLHDISSLFPENEKSRLADRFIDAARSITNYIAEGSANNKNQFIHSLKMAQSTIRQCLVFTTISYRANYISDTHDEISRGYLMELTKMTGALIASLQRSMGNNNYGNNSYNNGTQSNHSRNYLNEPTASNSQY